MEEEAQANINFVPCVKWVKKGVASENPSKVQLSKAELVQIIRDTKQKLNVTTNENENEQIQGESSGTDQYKFDNYDDDDEANTASLLGISSLAELSENAADNFSESDDSNLV